MNVGRSEAIKLGLTRYFTGKPCKRGHIAERLTSCGRCIVCHEAQRAEWRQTPQGKEARARWDRTFKHMRRLRGASKRNAMPPWADKKAISKFYRQCPPGFHVDHIVPLNGQNICGLHIIENMQYLPAEINLIKSNNLDSSVAVGYFCPVGFEKPVKKV